MKQLSEIEQARWLAIDFPVWYDRDDEAIIDSTGKIICFFDSQRNSGISGIDKTIIDDRGEFISEILNRNKDVKQEDVKRFITPHAKKHILNQVMDFMRGRNYYQRRESGGYID